MTEITSEKIDQFSIGFYNLKNLFDTVDDPKTLDDDFTEFSEKKWNEQRFDKKIKKLGRVVSNIGYQDIKHPPVLLGVAEVENAAVLEVLVTSKFLKKKGYDYVHFDSPDERGIDTALLYRKEYFSVVIKETFTVYLTNETGERDYTRDILYVHGMLKDQSLHILVNHWPSRRKGTKQTEHKRVAAAKRNLEIIERIFEEEVDPKVLIMGDFNDDPHCESIKRLMTRRFYNPMEVLLTKYEGTLSHKGNWHLFDQIIISHNFLLGHDNPFQYKSANIFSPDDLKEYNGKYKGLPFRTYGGKKYLGGFSDHFPVYAIFTIE